MKLFHTCIQITYNGVINNYNYYLKWVVDQIIRRNLSDGLVKLALQIPRNRSLEEGPQYSRQRSASTSEPGLHFVEWIQFIGSIRVHYILLYFHFVDVLNYELFIWLMGNVEGDKPPSQKTLQKVKACKQFVEEYYWELLAYIHARNKRHEKLIAKLAESKENNIMKENLCTEHIKKETTLLRSRRLCGRLSDFILLKRIGKGAYGEVRFLLIFILSWRIEC